MDDTGPRLSASGEPWVARDGMVKMGRPGKMAQVRVSSILFHFIFLFLYFLFSISNLNYPNQIQIHVLNFQLIKFIPNEDITSTFCINIIFLSIPFISYFHFQILISEFKHGSQILIQSATVQ